MAFGKWSGAGGTAIRGINYSKNVSGVSGSTNSPGSFERVKAQEAQQREFEDARTMALFKAPARLVSSAMNQEAVDRYLAKWAGAQETSGWAGKLSTGHFVRQFKGDAKAVLNANKPPADHPRKSFDWTDEEIAETVEKGLQILKKNGVLEWSGGNWSSPRNNSLQAAADRFKAR